MLNVVDIEYIRRKHYIEGWSIRKISRQLEVSRPTIRKALESAEPWHYTLTRAKPCPDTVGEPIPVVEDIGGVFLSCVSFSVVVFS